MGAEAAVCAGGEKYKRLRLRLPLRGNSSSPLSDPAPTKTSSSAVEAAMETVVEQKDAEVAAPGSGGCSTRGGAIPIRSDIAAGIVAGNALSDLPADPDGSR